MNSNSKHTPGKFNISLIETAVNAYFHEAGKELAKKDLGDIERQQWENIRSMCKDFFDSGADSKVVTCWNEHDQLVKSVKYSNVVAYETSKKNADLMAENERLKEEKKLLFDNLSRLLDRCDKDLWPSAYGMAKDAIEKVTNP